jgi:hypothetical protein
LTRAGRVGVGEYLEKEGRVMREAHTILELIRERGKKGLP